MSLPQRYTKKFLDNDSKKKKIMIKDNNETKTSCRKIVSVTWFDKGVSLQCSTRKTYKSRF